MAMVWAWCRKRSRIAPAVGTSPNSLPYSSSGRLLVMMVDRFWRSPLSIIRSKRRTHDEPFTSCSQILITENPPFLSWWRTWLSRRRLESILETQYSAFVDLLEFESHGREERLGQGGIRPAQEGHDQQPAHRRVGQAPGRCAQRLSHTGPLSAPCSDHRHHGPELPAQGS